MIDRPVVLPSDRHKMAHMSDSHSNQDEQVDVLERIAPASRVTGLVRASLLGAGGSLLILPMVLAWPNIRHLFQFQSRRLTDYSLILFLGFFAFVGALVCGRAIQWLAYALWLGPLGVFRGRDRLELRLGPFGCKRLDFARMRVAYSFDLDEEDPDPDLLAIDEEEELANFLPRIEHPAVAGNIKHVILRFAAAEQAELAKRLRPVFEPLRPESDDDD